MAQNTDRKSPKDSFAYKLSDSICRWFIVSVLTWLCCIPVFTIGTASCAALSVFYQDIPELRDIFRVYFANFRAFFKRTAPIFLLFLLILLLLLFNLSFYQQYIEPGTFLYYAVMGIVIALILTAISMLRFYHYEVNVGEALTFKTRFMRAIARMVRCLPVTGLLALLDIGLAATIAGAPVILPLLLIYPGMHAFLTCILISWFERKRK